MGIRVSGECKICNDGVVKRLISRAKGICIHHYQVLKAKEVKEKVKGKKAQKGYSGIAARSKKGEEVDAEDDKFFRGIWKKRKHESEVSGDPLPEKMSRWFMSHVLSKAAYPKFRHVEENVLLMTKAEHFIWEFGNTDDKKWDKVKELRDKLKEKYYNDDHSD